MGRSREVEQGGHGHSKNHPCQRASRYPANDRNFTSIFEHQGERKQAEDLEAVVLSARKMVLGDGHQDILTSMNNLAVILNRHGRVDEAGRLQVTVLEARKKILGDEHLDTLVSMYNLAITLTELGRLDEAEELYMQSLSIKKRVFGVGQHMHARWRPA